MAWYDSYVHRVPGVQGGYPVVKGTRTPVRSVVTYYFHLYNRNLHEVQRALPHLTPNQIRAALSYYRRNRSIVDEDIRRQASAAAAFKR